MTIQQSRIETATSETQSGAGRFPGRSVVDVYTAELGAVPDEFVDHAPALSTEPISRERYYSREFHDLEIEHVWKHTWQLACLESDLPEVGDTFVYDVGPLSMLLIRVEPDLIKAYWNSCLHRGTKLRTCEGRVSEVRCPFHGWAWNLDGSLKQLPGAWDLKHLQAGSLSLPEIQVDSWAGFVMVNPDPDAAPLRDHLEVIPDHFERWPMRNRVKASHAEKVFRANWKVVMGAFLEAYHLVSTHPQSTPVNDGESVQCNIYGNTSRLFILQGVASASWAEKVTEQEILDATFDLAGIPERFPLPDGMTARAFLSHMLGDVTRQKLGTEPACSPGELLDLPIYYMFPNFAVWGGYFFPAVYRFRPYGDDPEMSVMDVIVMEPYPADGPRPEPVPVHRLGPDDSFVGTPGLLIPDVFDQDAENIPNVQRGIRASSATPLQLCNYQESLIRWHNDLIDEYLAKFGGDSARPVRPA